MKKQVLENSKKADLNKGELDKQKQSIQVLVQKENGEIDKEKKQIEELQKKIAELEANQKKRQDNIEQYNALMTKADQEKLAWDEQKKGVDQVLQQIDAKEKTAMADKSKWEEKQKAYKTEVSKWSKQANTSQGNYKKYKKLAP
jgi:uncharacterized phage infection (PIP) family protein YhgE